MYFQLVPEAIQYANYCPHYSIIDTVEVRLPIVRPSSQCKGIIFFRIFRVAAVLVPAGHQDILIRLIHIPGIDRISAALDIVHVIHIIIVYRFLNSKSSSTIFSDRGVMSVINFHPRSTLCADCGDKCHKNPSCQMNMCTYCSIASRPAGLITSHAKSPQPIAGQQKQNRQKRQKHINRAGNMP